MKKGVYGLFKLLNISYKRKMDDDGDIFALINEECEINDKWEEER